MFVSSAYKSGHELVRLGVTVAWEVNKDTELCGASSCDPEATSVMFKPSRLLEAFYLSKKGRLCASS